MSDCAFGTLTPRNALARLGPSDLSVSLTIGRQNALEDGSPALCRLAIEPQQTFVAKVLPLKLEAEKRVSESSQNAYLSDVETSESFAELDSDTQEQQHKELGMIWQGQ